MVWEKTPTSQYPRPSARGRASAGPGAGVNRWASVTPPARSLLLSRANWTLIEPGPAKKEFTAKGAAVWAVSATPVAA